MMDKKAIMEKITKIHNSCRSKNPMCETCINLAISQTKKALIEEIRSKTSKLEWFKIGHMDVIRVSEVDCILQDLLEVKQ